MWRRFWGDRQGNIAVLFAMGFAVSAVLGAVAVDAASLYHERRVIQNGVDLAALAGATDFARARGLVEAALREAGLLDASSTAGLLVETGHYRADPAVQPDKRFVAGALPLNAVRVRLTRPGTLHFAQGWAPVPAIGAEALATRTPQVAFSIGSRLASLQGGIANAVLNALLGTDIALSALDYNSLLTADVDLLGFLDALAQELHLQAGTYNDLLGMEADHGQIARALARTVPPGGRAAAQALGRVAGHNGAVPLGRLLQLGGLGDLALGSGSGGALFASLSAIELLSASAALGNGRHEVALQLAAGVPGLVGIEAALAVGEPPQGISWFQVGPSGSVVRTAQLRLKLVATVLGSGALAGVPIRLPLYLELAPVEAVVTQASCPSAAQPNGAATLAVKPGALRLRLGEVDPARFSDFGHAPPVGTARLLEVRVLGLVVLQVLGASLVEIAQTSPVSMPFSSLDIGRNQVKTASVTTPVASLATSMVGNLVLEMPVLGLGLNLSSLRPLLRTILLPLALTLDTTIHALLASLGVRVGEADVRVYGVRCGQPVLVG